MKQFLKRLPFLTLVLLLAFSLSTTVFAVPASITFNGFSDGFDFQPGSEYTETDLFDNLKGVMPGDTLTQSITFTNSAPDCDFVQLYLRAVTHDETDNPLSEKVAEQETVATMRDFLSQLSMKVWNGTSLIYAASADALDGLEHNVFLGTFRTGETTTMNVELTVPIELDNRYANRVGEVDWVFHVEAYNESQLSVRKVWSDGNAAHANDSITVNLLRDGKVVSSAVLNAKNGWTYTFDRLLEGHSWTVEEAEIPEGYTVSYEIVGTSVTIINTKDAPPHKEPLDLVVKKIWNSDETTTRPDVITVTLYDGQTAYETVHLNKQNNWTYHWEDSSALGNWQVVESNIPKGYTPSYSVLDNVTTITNTSRLPQTGQRNWPIALLGGIGLVLVVLGGIMLLRKRSQKNA